MLHAKLRNKDQAYKDQDKDKGQGQGLTSLTVRPTLPPRRLRSAFAIRITEKVVDEFLRIFGGLGCLTGNKPFDFGADLDHDP